MQRVSRRAYLFLLFFVASCQLKCPSSAGGNCDPRNFDCPGDYYCAQIEICTKQCEQTSDCWIPSNNGCRYGEGPVPGTKLSDGGVFQDVDDEGYCTDSRALECIGGYCIPPGFPTDDMYGPSPNKGNRSQGPGVK
ncbi:MAG: hypothetical protein DI536_29995 [Archangium gephyra]|uniref:Lipoprotein n=1 Tax=Archangium gephyra TaxID=48 RepID=A0A2W5SUW5_9BACT|nr:MAG: hypothetical protein DI536_29995 [Archangium gephyra]